MTQISSTSAPTSPASLMCPVMWDFLPLSKCFCQAHPGQGDPARFDAVKRGKGSRAETESSIFLSPFSRLSRRRVQRVTLLIDAHLDVLIDSLIKLRPSIRKMSGHWPSTLIRHAVTPSVASTWVQSAAPSLQRSEPFSHSSQTHFPPACPPECEIYQRPVSVISPKPGHLFFSELNE